MVRLSVGERIDVFGRVSQEVESWVRGDSPQPLGLVGIAPFEFNRPEAGVHVEFTFLIANSPPPSGQRSPSAIPKAGAKPVRRLHWTGATRRLFGVRRFIAAFARPKSSDASPHSKNGPREFCGPT